MSKQARAIPYPDTYVPPTRIYGVDFSGAADAGKHIWIAECVVAQGRLEAHDCRAASEYLGVSSARKVIFPALVDFVAKQRATAFGFDFPFGIPQSLVREGSWAAFVAEFPSRYPSLADFDKQCHAASGGREWKRLCDTETRTPFSPYNRRVISQTYYGIRDLLYPLISSQQVSVPPMLVADRAVPWLLEICPKSSLETLSLPFRGYKKGVKGIKPEQRQTREQILSGLESRNDILLNGTDLRQRILSDPGGDGLDSVVAAYTAFRIVQEPSRLYPDLSPEHLVEGYVYVP